MACHVFSLSWKYPHVLQRMCIVLTLQTCEKTTCYVTTLVTPLACLLQNHPPSPTYLVCNGRPLHQTYLIWAEISGSFKTPALTAATLWKFMGSLYSGMTLLKFM